MLISTLATEWYKIFSSILSIASRKLFIILLRYKSHFKNNSFIICPKFVTLIKEFCWLNYVLYTTDFSHFTKLNKITFWKILKIICTFLRDVVHNICKTHICKKLIILQHHIKCNDNSPAQWINTSTHRKPCFNVTLRAMAMLQASNSCTKTNSTSVMASLSKGM